MSISLLPLKSMLERVTNNSTSDSELFHELLYAGEFILKATTATFASCIEDDRDNHRYRILHSLVRADGVGEWSTKLDEMLVGPASQHLANSLQDVRRAFTERLGNDAWQHRAASSLQQVLNGVVAQAAPVPDKTSLRQWFTTFPELRNKTRGHGALTPATCAKFVAVLQESIRLVAENSPLFQLSFAFLHRNLSGKYKVIELSANEAPFAALKTSAANSIENLADGIYVFAGRPRRVELIHSDLNVSDFMFPNGAFNGKTYELHSLITDSRASGDASPYLAASGDRPIVSRSVV